MSVVQIDTEQSARATAIWVRWGDHVSRAHTDIDRTLRGLSLTSPAVTNSLAEAAVELWTASALLDHVIGLVTAADHGSTSVSLDAAQLVDVMARARSLVTRLATGCAWSPAAGELDGTGCREPRTPYALAGDDPVELGRSLVVRALADTAASFRVRPDEFELVQLADGRYLVVLPGVTDLSVPDPGLSDVNRTVRDLDQHAVRSWTSSTVDDNRYAQMVWSALDAAGVPSGSELVIVGHSYGADTALDLAADSDFNGGPLGYRVSHVVAAGYDSAPQLAQVPESTSVLVLQNARDAAVIAEAAGRASPLVVAERTAEVAWAVSLAAVELVTGVDADASRRLEQAVTLTPGVEVDQHGVHRQVVVVFEGGSSGAGHHPDHYVDYLAGSDAQPVLDFLAGLGTGSGVGIAVAIDVSVPSP